MEGGEAALSSPPVHLPLPIWCSHRWSFGVRHPGPERAVSRATPQEAGLGLSTPQVPSLRLTGTKTGPPLPPTGELAAWQWGLPSLKWCLPLEASGWGWGESGLMQPPGLWGPQNHLRAEKGVWWTLRGFKCMPRRRQDWLLHKLSYCSESMH